ncbi:MAG: hypothetical protein JW781_08650 [Deltaproteobacteria bacterium]|nr:hypothetical protein [Candidatus Anaeroferrophillacea bacterium]
MNMANGARRFIFLGGIPVFDYHIRIDMDEIMQAVNGRVISIDRKVLLPVGTVFRCRVKDHEQPVYINPMAAAEAQSFNDELYYAMELGGKHPEQFPCVLRTEDPELLVRDLSRMFPEHITAVDDLHIVDIGEPAEIKLGGNNRNIIEAIRTLYDSPEIAETCRSFTFEHLFFFDVKNPKYRLVRDFYQELGVGIGELTDLHIDKLIPRISYVITIHRGETEVFDRIVLSNRTNEEIIPVKRLIDRYFKLEYKLRRDADFIDTALVINSLTNHEELRLITRILRTAYAGGVTSYLCPTKTFFKCADRLLESRYYTTEKGKFYDSRKEYLYTDIIPYVQYLILNTEELNLLDNVAEKQGIDVTASILARQLNQGKKGQNDKGGRILLTSGHKGARYTERLTAKRARLYWQKAHLPESKFFNFRFADRRILCGDDHVVNLYSTLGAGDTFTGIFIALKALNWDGGHALRAATLGAQHFIQHGRRPGLKDIIRTDEAHILMGTETTLRDIISYHISESGDPTRYGTITDTVVTINTTQIQHPFSEILHLARELSDDKRNRAVTPLPMARKR